MFKAKSFLYEAELQREMELRNYSVCTVKNYKSHLRRFSEFFNRDLKLLSTDDFKEYLYHLTTKRKLGPNSINTCRSAFLFFHFAVMNDPVNPLLIPAQRKNHKLPCILSRNEILHLLNSIHNLKYRAVLSLCYGSGLRISEALRIQVSDIDSKKMRLFVRQSKGRRERYTLLSHYSYQLLRQYWKKFRPQGPLVFPGRCPHHPIAVQNVQAEMQFAVSSAGLVAKGKITTHTLRHCFATHLLDSDCDLRTIQLFLGHASINLTCIYLHLTDQHFAALKSPIDRRDGDFLDF